MISSRRNFLLGAGAALLTAPAIVRSASLMPVKQMLLSPRRRMFHAKLDPTTKLVYWVNSNGDRVELNKFPLTEKDDKPYEDFWERGAVYDEYNRAQLIKPYPLPVLGEGQNVAHYFSHNPENFAVNDFIT
jgi:hypothetical protein